MLNGKFYTGLPAKMIDRRPTCNRQETHFFWPDDTESESTVDSKIKRRTSIQAENKQAYNKASRAADQSISDAENKERFKKEFTRSSIQFYDNVGNAPMQRNRNKLTTAPVQKLQNVEPPQDFLAKRKENLSSKIEFFDYGQDLNNVPKTDKNNKAELERNSKNSPKLQNKNLSFNPPPDEAINFIENDVRNMRITAPPRRRNPGRDSRPRYERSLNIPESIYSDFHDEYIPPRRRPLHPAPLPGRYSESDPDFDEYSIPRRSQSRPTYFAREPLDYIDGHSSARHNTYNDDDGDDKAVPRRKLGQQVHYSYSSANEYNSNYEELPPQPHSSAVPQRMQRKTNISKVDNDTRNNEQGQMPSSPATSPSSQHHLRSHICFSDTESAPPPSAPTSSTTSSRSPPAAPPPAARRNIRSSAVNRVSVGLPD